MCLIDLHNTNANSQETDHESDSDQGSSLYAESEQIRFKTIRILNALFSLELTEEETKEQEDELKTSKSQLALMSLQLVIKELTQISNIKGLQNCLSVLLQIQNLIPNDDCSKIIEDLAVLRCLDTHMQKGSLMHKMLAYTIIGNFVVNS